MTTNVVTSSDDLPVSLAEAKRHLRVVNGDYDVQVLSLIAAATEFCESQCGRALRSSQRLTQTYRDWPCNPVRLNRHPPLETVGDESAIEIRYFDAAGQEQTVDASAYRLHKSKESAGYVEFAADFTFPELADRDDAVTIDFHAGYGSAPAVPYRARQAILLLVGHWFEHGEAVNIGNSTSEVPLAAMALLNSLDPGIYR